MLRLSIALLFFSSAGFSQPAHWLKLSILGDSLRVDSCNMLRVNYAIENASGIMLTCYRLDSRIGDANTGRLDLFCDIDRVGAGIVFSVFDDRDQFKSGTYSHVVQNRPMTPKEVDSLIAIARTEAIKSSVTLKKGELHSMQKIIDLAPLNLAKCIYYFQLVYYSGKKVESLLGEQRLTSDRMKLDGRIYQGCVISNKVVLVVD